MAMPGHPAGTFCWFECGSRDSAKSKSFHAQLFGWKVVDMPMPGDMGTYTLLKVGDEDVAGLYELSGPRFEGVPSHWMTYIAVDNVDTTVGRAQELGAKVMAEPMDVPEAGRIAVLQDPTGAVIAIAHFDKHPGTSLKGPFGWIELATRDTAGAQTFYTELFSWTAKTDPKNQYTKFQVGGKSIAGMMEMTPQHGQAPAHWLPYVMVDSCDDTISNATELGATVYVPPMDIEKVGRFSVFADPAGAVLAVIQLLPR